MQYKDMLYYNDACGHVIHEKCMISTVFALPPGRQAVCPMCRKPLPDEDVAWLKRDKEQSFEFAVKQNDLMTLRDLITAPGYDINALQYYSYFLYLDNDSFLSSPLMFAIYAGATSEVVKLLLGVEGLNVNTEAGHGQTALMVAVSIDAQRNATQR
jgi:hypothetical protein